MDNFNGQNQFNANQMNQNQFAQGQYQQMPQQQMYQQPQNYGNGYYGQPYAAKPKKKWLKWTLIIGIPVLVATITTIILILIFTSGYDIDNYKDVSKAADKTLNVELEKMKADMLEYYEEEYDIVDIALGRGESDDEDLYSYIQWIKFKNEKAAKKYYKEQVSELREEYNEEKSECELKHWESDDDYTEAYLGEDGEIGQYVYILEDEYMLIFMIEGDKKDVEKATDKFLDEID